MAEHLTIFELHVDGAQFGPRTVSVPDGEEPAEEAAADRSRGPGPVLALVAVAALVAGAVLVRRRRAARRDADDGVEIVAESPASPVD